ncbi:hypothetical protein ABZP36_018647 [Zizania latifolia]
MDDVVELSSSATRHSCKVCGKGFPSGRSLGGHMRSHSPTEAAAGDDDTDADEGDEKRERRWIHSGVRVSSVVVGVGGGGYGLRENPKKTRRLSGSGSDDDGNGRDDRGDLFSSCRTVLGHVRCHAPGGVCAEDAENVDANVHDGQEEMLIPGEPAVMMPAPRRRRRTTRVPAPARDAFDEEPEDVAHCLVMMSRDTSGRWDSSEKYTNADSDENSSLFQYADDGEITRSKKSKTTPSTAAGEKRSRYECPGCGRAFQSYQALGGHRASHKRINSNCCLVKAVPDQPEHVEKDASFSTASTSASPDVVDADDRASALHKAAKKAKGMKFECPICYKVFGSGQALGGHKRSHSIAGETERASDGAGVVRPEQSPLTKRFLDLNLPAPAAEE